tara:strand:- start:679 stop:1152 length:474 start_codon:yes stop_codon:yes gene_type:complete
MQLMPKLLLGWLVLVAVVPASAQHHGHELHAMPDEALVHEGHGDNHQQQQAELVSHQDQSGYSRHNHSLGPFGASYDLRSLDAMNLHYAGVLRISEYVFGIGAPGPAHLAHSTGIYKSEAEAKDRANELGCDSVHQNNGRWMPCVDEAELHRMLRKE